MSNEDIKKILGRNIKAERMRKGYTQEKFSELINVSISHVSKIEQGLTTPAAFVLYRMSKILNITMEEFFKGLDFVRVSKEKDAN